MSEDEWHCQFAGRRKANGNCEVLDADGHPVQGVGEWTPEKHERLAAIIDATWAARARYVPPQRGKGGAAFVDLFAGPGLVRVQNRPEVHKGSPLIALAHTRAPFSKVILCDLDRENIAALKARTAPHREKTTIVHGDSNECIVELVTHIPPYGLNMAFVDPFGPKALQWATLEQLGRFERMDLLVNVPIGFIKRNFHAVAFRSKLTAMLGSDSWQTSIKRAEDATRIIELLRARLAPLGYKPERSRAIAITNSMNVPMFYLAFFSKHDLGGKIWKSLTTYTSSGQKDFGFE